MAVTRWLGLVALLAGACGGGREQGGDTASQVAPGATPGATPGGRTGGAPGAVAAGGPGAELYRQRCASCHQQNGEGVQGGFPPLAGSEWVTGSAAVPIRIVLHGLQGPITVRGTAYNGLMPPGGLGVVPSDDEAAAILTYVRSAWGNQAPAVTAVEVAQVRATTAGRATAWTAEELTPLLR